MTARRKATMGETVVGKVRLKLLPGSRWISSPVDGERAEYRDGDLIEAELDAERKPVEENLRGLMELGFAEVVEG
jgi:hypothetical protein